MPLPAGTGLSRRSFVASEPRRDARRLRRLAARPRRVRGRASRCRRDVARAAGARQHLPRGRRRRALGALAAGRPALPQAAPEARAQRRAAAFAEDNRLHWHPATAGLAQLYGEQKVARHAGRRLHERRPEPLHVAPLLGGRRDERHLRTGWLGRYLDRVGTMDNPLQGLSLDNSLAPALATAKVPVASIDGPDQYDFWSNHVWGEVEQRMLAAIGAFGAPGVERPRARSRGARQQPGRPAPHTAPAVPGATTGITSPVPYPKSSDSVPETARRARRDARRRPAAARRLAERARALRHALRPGGRARTRACR